MKKIKSILSIVLVCAMVLSGISTSWVAKAETTYSLKEDFENGKGASDDWSSSAFQIYNPDIEGYSNENVHQGSNSLKISSAGDWKTYRPNTNIQLEKGKTYKISFWYKGTATTVDGTDYQTKSLFYFQINGEATSTRTYHQHTNGEWTQIEEVYTVSDANSAAEGKLSLTFVSYNHPTGAFEIYLDDIVVGEEVTVSAANDGNGTATVNGMETLTSYTNGTVTYVATANKGYSFVGWKNSAGEVVSTETTYVHDVTGAITLTAHFEKILRQIEDFENGQGASDDWSSTAFQIYNPDIEGYLNENVHQGTNSLKISSAGDWRTYRPNTNIQLEKGKTYKISFWYKGTATTVDGTDYQTKSLFYFQINGEATSTRTYHQHTNGEWTQIEEVYTVSDTNSAAEGKLSLTFVSYNHPTGAFEIYLDDIEVREAFTVLAESDGNGTATVNGQDSVTAAAYDEVTYVATPNDNYDFVAWENASGDVVSTDLNYTTVVKDNITLKAYFKRVYSNIEDFENGQGASDDWSSSAFQIYNPDIEGYSNENVHQGSNSLKISSAGEMKTYRPNTNIQLEKGKTYKISFWYKATATTDYQASSLFYFQINGEVASTRTFHEHTNGEWTQIEKVYTVSDTNSAAEGKLSLTFVSYDHPTGAFEIYIDDIRVGEPIEVSAESDGNGTATATVNNSALEGFYVNDTITYQATPNPGYAFKCWTDAEGNEVSTDAAYEFIVKNGMTLKANFEKVLYGDVNDDKEIDIVDLVRLDNYLEDTSLTINSDLADCYMDEVIDVTDWTTLRKALLNLIELPVSETEAMSLDFF